jgi:hypothetical protein
MPIQFIVNPFTGQLDADSPASLPPSVPTTFTEDSGTATPAANNLNIVGGAGITTSGSGSTVTITATGAGFAWNTVAGTTQAVVKENGYINANAGLTTFTLPATAAVGDTFQIAGYGAGGWALAQNAGQKVYLGSRTTTAGAGGSLASTAAHDTIEVVCVVANTEFQVVDVIGNITVV